jgi:uncharacterized membrane protein (GlpM family)
VTVKPEYRDAFETAMGGTVVALIGRVTREKSFIVTGLGGT